MNIFEQFGSYLFGKEEMKKRLPRPIYLKWKTAVYNETSIDRETADAIAHAMKMWAIERGATHYSHWFQPLHGRTAEKHVSFVGKYDDKLLVRFSGKELIKGETDGSSFPSGGLRATFEARGYTYWDITSFAFVRGHVLYIPSIFISYRGDKLDMKAPLLGSIDKFNECATKLLHLLGEKEVKSVKPMLGLEQEYFLISDEHFNQRPDLYYTGRTLLGLPSPRGQEFEDHYFSSIDPKVNDFMNEVNTELWKLGVFASIEHNETAPSQYEIAALYETAVIAIDQNMLVMEVLQKVAKRHGMVCLLHEKPFKGINGSGKHNNISFETNDGDNIFDPGETPYENTRFLLFIAAFIASVDRFSELIRMACSDAGNDHRLGAGEAPPAIISVFMGERLNEIIMNMIENPQLNPEVIYRKLYTPLNNIDVLPYENTDRNRTSPVTFTGNKFEIRMLGSSISAAMLNLSIYSAYSYVISEINERLEQVEEDERENEALNIAKELYKKHKRVLFIGDGYSKEWIEEAQRRGLSNISSYTDSIDTLLDPKVIEMFESVGVLSKDELAARRDVLHRKFNNIIHTEGMTLISMVKRQIIPALMKYIREIMRTDFALDSGSRFIQERKDFFAKLLDTLADKTHELEEELDKACALKDITKRGSYMVEVIRPLMKEVAELCNMVEGNISAMHYPYPTYTDMLYIS